MASALIHLAVAKRVNEVLKLENEKHFLFGSIAPDIAKMVGSTRNKSHFILENENTDTPNVDRFLKKYKKYLKNPYELGYFVHLTTDVLWFDEFLPNFHQENYMINSRGEKIKFDEDELLEILYNDYTNLNKEVLSYYNLDLSLFYEEFEFPINHIEEVSSEHFQDVIDKMGVIVKDVSNASYVLKIESIIHFIEYATIYCLDEIKKIDLV